MRVKSGTIVVFLIAAAIVAYRTSTKHSVLLDGKPRIVLVADLGEADSADPCTEIIRTVRAARDRGIRVQELNSDSKSDILHRYHVLTIPTVLILDDSGQVVSRFEGEDQDTVVAIRTQVAKLK